MASSPSPLLALPAELRLQIFAHLPDLSPPTRHEIIGPNVRMTPAISRVNRLLRAETLLLYARTSAFVISLQPDDLRLLGLSGSSSSTCSDSGRSSRVGAWLAALGGSPGDEHVGGGDEALQHVRSLQLSRDWVLSRPSRWQGHVGFYVRLQRGGGDGSGSGDGGWDGWRCEAGTYPIANDLRGLRAESVEVLKGVVSRRMAGRGRMDLRGERMEQSLPRTRELERVDVEFIVRAMDIVATHPISSFDMEQSEAGRRQRREVWMEMEKLLNALDIDDTTQCEPKGIGRPENQSTRFYTPY